MAASGSALGLVGLDLNPLGLDEVSSRLMAWTTVESVLQRVEGQPGQELRIEWVDLWG